MKLLRYLKYYVIIWMLGICLCGKTIAQSPEIDLSEKYRLKSIEYEKGTEYQKAIWYLKIAGKLNPDNAMIAQQLSELVSKVNRLADEHYRKGVALFQKKAFDEAQKEFLIALRYQPEHEKALEYIKQKPVDAIYLSYTVQAGDDLKSIARSVYKDPDKAFVLAYFNNLKPETVPSPGTVLKYPVIELQPALTKEIDIDKQIEQAKSLFESKKYDKVIEVTKQILDKDYLNSEAGNMANASYYESGIELSNQKKYKEALEMLNKADPSYPGVAEAIANIRVLAKKEADFHYKEGVKYFVKDQLEKAIQEWETTLMFDPDHQNASRDIENAKKLLEKLKKVQ